MRRTNGGREVPIVFGSDAMSGTNKFWEIN